MSMSACQGGRIQTYPAALACRREQRNCVVARARDHGPTPRVACHPAAASHALKRAHTLDESVGLVFVRPPVNVIVQRAAARRRSRRACQTELGRRAVRGDGDAQLDHERVQLDKQRVGELQNDAVDGRRCHASDSRPKPRPDGAREGRGHASRKCAIATLRADSRSW